MAHESITEKDEKNIARMIRLLFGERLKYLNVRTTIVDLATFGDVGGECEVILREQFCVSISHEYLDNPKTIHEITEKMVRDYFNNRLSSQFVLSSESGRSNYGTVYRTMGSAGGLIKSFNIDFIQTIPIVKNLNPFQ